MRVCVARQSRPLSQLAALLGERAHIITVHVWRIIPDVRGVDYRERDLILRDS